jgi:aminopeptidase N
MLKHSFFFITFFFCVALRAQNNIDVLHYQFGIELSDSSDIIRGRALVQVKFLENSSRFFLQLVSRNEKGKGMIAYRVLREGEAVSSAHGHDTLSIFLSSPASKDEISTYEILYEGIPADGLIIAKNRHGDRTFFADNWPDRAHNWLPCIDQPGDKASFEFIVTAPSQYKIIANGYKTEEQETANGKKMTHWKEDTALSTKIMVIGGARFAVKTFTDSPSTIPISAWAYPQDSSKVFINFSPAPAIVKFLSSYIAPYPYEKLANVQSKTVFGGMENAGAIFYDEGLSASPTPIESLLVHEIAHQWFGDMASEKSFAHLWLSEGFATYFTHIYIESKYGTDSLEKEMKEDRASVIAFSKSSKQPVVDPLSPYRSLLNPNSYQKGGWILHMLRRQLGDSVFRSIIRNYYAAYAGKNADTRDFQKICEKVSGKNMDGFFRQWLYTAGQPRLAMQWKYDSKNKRILITTRQLQPDLFEFPIDIQVKFTSSKMLFQTLSVSKQQQQFIIKVKEKPLQLVWDPHTSLLFEGEGHTAN